MHKHILRVSEIFDSIQGEGPYLGAPATFIRFYGCNKHCSFCDSRHSWEGGEFKKMTCEQIIAGVRQRTSEIVVLTGGEPTCQPPFEMFQLCHQLHKAGKSVHVETNGTQLDSPWLLTTDVVVVSPKGDEWKEAKLLRALALEGRLFFKIVGLPLELVQFFDLLMRSYSLLPYIPIYVSPRAPVPFSLQEYLNLLRSTAELVKRVQPRVPWQLFLTAQMHKLLWGDERLK